jgi:hypothetical protein
VECWACEYRPAAVPTVVSRPGLELTGQNLKAVGDASWLCEDCIVAGMRISAWQASHLLESLSAADKHSQVTL